jgi:urease accessory protein
MTAMKSKRVPGLIAAATALVIPAVAYAHPGHDGHDFGWDFSSGFGHPLFGFDHLLAMLAVGLWAAQLGGRARWLVPATFVALMIAGAAMARQGLAISGVEQVIATSVLILGLLLATAATLPVAVGMALVGLFAAFHGYAHGAEMPANSQALGYGAGFVLATVLIHATGVGLGVLAAQRSPKVTRIAGWIIAASGLVLFAV